MIGQTVSHYRIIEKLGAGGMGVVYKAQDLKLERLVALKFLPPSLDPDPSTRERFVHEAKAASALDHPNICTIHEVGESEDGQLFIVMGYYEGQTLKQRIDQGEMPLDEVFTVALAIGAGLQRAHASGIVHRDIKPANIIVTTHGEIKILDFGLAKLTGASMLTRSGSTIGTAAYMSPEQARGESVDHRADIWAFGVVLYEMLAGRRPFASDYEQALLYSILNEAPKPLRTFRPGHPEALEHIVAKALAKIPDERYAKMEDLLNDLRQVQSGRLEATATAAGLEVNRKTRKRLTLRFAVIGAAVVLAAVWFLAVKPSMDEKAMASNPIPIAVISFENLTGDRTYDDLQKMIPNLLITSLEQSKYVRVTTWERMRNVLKQIGKKDLQFVDKDMGVRLCRQEGVQLMVLGSFARAGDLFVTDMKVVDVNTLQLVKGVRASGKGVESLLEAQIDELSSEISGSAGISKRWAGNPTKPIQDILTKSSDAYRAYMTGVEYAYQNRTDSALLSFRKAVAEDSMFASAYLYLGQLTLAYTVGRDGLNFIKKAQSLAYKCPEKERLLIESVVAEVVEKDRQKQLEVLLLLKGRFPQEQEIYGSLFNLYRAKKQWGQMAEVAERMFELRSDNPLPLKLAGYNFIRENIDTAQGYAYFDRFFSTPEGRDDFDARGDVALFKASIGEARQWYEKSGNLFKVSYCAALEGRFQEAAQLLAGERSRASNGTDRVLHSADSVKRSMLSFWIELYNYYAGAYVQALSNAKEQRTYSGDRQGWGNEATIVEAWIALARGNLKESRSTLRQAYEFIEKLPPGRRFSRQTYSKSKDPTYLVGLGLIEIQQKQFDSARVRIEGLLKVYKGERTFWSDLLQAELLLAQDSIDRAVAAADQLTPRRYLPNLDIPADAHWHNYPYEIDVLARAYIKKGNSEKAIEAYKRLLVMDVRSNVRRLPNPRYLYRLASLYDKQGMKEEAVQAYRQFLELWKNADRNLPEAIDAKKRLAVLTG